MKTDDNNKLISLNKETYHIPMYNPEKWEKDLTNEKFIHHKVLNRSFLMTKEYLNFLKNRNPGNIPIKQIHSKAQLQKQQQMNTYSNKFPSNLNSLGMQVPNKIIPSPHPNNPSQTTPNQLNKFVEKTVGQFIYSTNLLRKPEKVISKEILIEKEKKDPEKKHPIKNLAGTIRSKIDDDY